MYDLYGALIGNLSNYLYTYILIILLVAGGIYFTVRTKFVQFRYLKESLRVVLAPSEDDKAISSFQALMVSTASRVGTGNIAGVSTAISRRCRFIILDVADCAARHVDRVRGGNSGADL